MHIEIFKQLFSNIYKTQQTLSGNEGKYTMLGSGQI